MQKKAVFVSCFDSYENRVKPFIEIAENENYKVEYLYADFDHTKKRTSTRIHKDGIRIRVIRYKRNMSPSRLLSHFVFSRQVIRHIKKNKPDFVYCMVPPNSLVKEIGKYKNKHKDMKLVFDVYDNWPESFPYATRLKLVEKVFEYWGNLRKKYLCAAEQIIVVSDEQKKILIEESKGKPIEVLRPIVPAGDIPQYDFNIDEFSFCYLGMINHITDIELGRELLGALAKVRKTTLHIIGEGQNLGAFVKCLEEEGVEVICHGCIFEQEEKNRIFSMCNLGLNIPREEINSTMSLKAIEYMRVGIPFVNNAGGEIRRIVDEDGVGINMTDDVELVVQKIKRMSKNEYIKMHINSLEAYNNRFLQQNYCKIFDDLLR